MPHEVPEAQHSLVREDSRELTREEYDRLLSDARAQGQERLALLMEAICASGIRVSEVRYITMKAARQGRAEIALKGKIRTIFIPSRLCRKLLQYARKHKTASGEIFLTRSGQNLSRKQIWAEMKALCRRAGVRPSKVFPHNLRHLSARIFYRVCRDVAKLADVLDLSSIETTRIYLITTGAEHARTLDRLQLILQKGQISKFVVSESNQKESIHSFTCILTRERLEHQKKFQLLGMGKIRF